MMERIKCPVSGKDMAPIFIEKVLNKYEATYYYCKESGLLKIGNPYWLDEAYQNPINDTDTGLVRRNIDNCAFLEVVLECLSIEKGKYLDIAGGYGLLTRLMRDRGFDCFTVDKYCSNIFARTFEPSDNMTFDALFAFEVLEHIEDPYQFLHDIFDRYRCRTLIFSTQTYGRAIPDKDWWYYSFESGKHITFYQHRTLGHLAKRLQCRYYQIDTFYHIITDVEIPLLKRIVLSNRYLRCLYSIYVRGKRRGVSRTWDDHQNIKTT